MYDVIIIGGMSNDVYGRALGPYRLRTSLEQRGYCVSILDYVSQYSKEHLLEILKCTVTDKTKIIGISFTWIEISPLLNTWLTSDFFVEVRILFPWVTIVFGGNRNTITPMVSNNADWFVTGFSDLSFPALVDKICKDSYNLRYFRVNNLALIDSNQWYQEQDVDLIETVFKKEDNFFSHQPIPLEVSRGCIFKCAFCSHPFLGKKDFNYIRSPESLAAELKRNYELFGTTRYIITDDTFNDGLEKLDRVKKAVDLAKLSDFEFVAYIKPELLITKPEMIPMLSSMGLKGAHFGVESWNRPARKIIGKGTPIEKILEVAEKLTSSGVRLHASHITGLPGDTEDDYYSWEDYMVKNIDTLFSSWWFNSLGIGSNPFDKGYSDIEKDPNKFGYTIIPYNKDEDANFGQFWKNWSRADGMNRWKAYNIAKTINDRAIKICRVGGWDVASAWFQGYSDIDINGELNREQVRRNAYSNFKKRAGERYKNITGDDISWT